MPFCTRCGSEVNEQSVFCTKCGNPLKEASSATAAAPISSPQPTISSTVQTPWGGALLLRNGEEISRYWGADHEVSQLAVVNGRRQTVKQRRKGYLVLTTQRLAFVQERGVFGKSYHIDMSFSLDSLGGLSMGGLVMKYVSISDSNGENVFHVQGVKNEVEFASFRATIQEQLVKMQQAIEAEKRRDRVQITLDFSFLRDYMSKGGLSVQVVKCPQCGAPISLPKEGSQTVCGHCGSTVFAQDIMEKVKQLIG